MPGPSVARARPPGPRGGARHRLRLPAAPRVREPPRMSRGSRKGRRETKGRCMSVNRNGQEGALERRGTWRREKANEPAKLERAPRKALRGAGREGGEAVGLADAPGLLPAAPSGRGGGPGQPAAVMSAAGTRGISARAPGNGGRRRRRALGGGAGASAHPPPPAPAHFGARERSRCPAPRGAFYSPQPWPRKAWLPWGRLP